MKKNDPVAAFAKYKLVLLFLALLGFIWIFLPTRHYGVGLSPDSLGYISVARNLMTGSGFVVYDGNPLVVQPPLFPMILALAGGLFKTDPYSIANIVNALAFGLIVYFGGIYTFRYFSSFPVFALLGTFAILTSIPLFQVSIMAWSEPLFILFVILSLLFADKYLENKDITSLALLSSSVALATVTRYIGVVLIIWGAFIIVVLGHDTIKNSIRHLLVFTFISTFPIGIWSIRNYALSNTFLGPRAPSVFTFSQNVMLVFNKLIAWYVPGIIADHRRTLLLLVATIGFFIGLNAKGNWQSIKARLRKTIPMVLFIFVYIIFLIISSTTTAYDSIDNRLLSPVYVPLTLFFLIAVQAIFEPFWGRFPNRIVRNSLTMIFLIWLLIYPLEIML